MEIYKSDAALALRTHESKIVFKKFLKIKTLEEKNVYSINIKSPKIGEK